MSLAAVLVLVLAVLSPASAQEAPAPEDFLTSEELSELEEGEQRRADIDDEIELLRQSDVELQAIADELEAEIAQLEATTGELSEELDKTRERIAELEVDLQDARAELERRHDLAIDRILAAYMHPPMETFAAVAQGEDINQVSARLGMLNEVAAQDQRIIAERAAAADALEDLEAEMAQTEADLQARSAQHETDLAALHDARAEHEAVMAALAERIADFQAEADALAASEAELEAILAARAATTTTTTTTTSTTTTSAIPNDTEAPTTTQPGSGGGTGQLAWPAEGPITSPYGQRWGSMHWGIDIGAPTGAPIFAAESGTVFHAANMGGYGLLTLIDHGGGMVTAYAHQSSFEVTSGPVSRGQVIGRIGSTGHSTGPHLHFEVRINGQAVDPMPYLR